MLQRIQSFYLVLVVVGIVLMFQFPMARYTMPSPMEGETITSELGLLPKSSQMREGSTDIADYAYIGQDVATLKGQWVLGVMAALIGITALVSIFLYKNRVRQMRVVACAALMNVIYLFLIFFWAINGMKGDGGYLRALQELHFTEQAISVDMWNVGSIVPIVTVVLLYLAQRAIRKDELKVRAADRLR
ncbi:MAG: DUF4293 domain-containing protein [Bacteroidales bacterium]|nr:DUF4293 domain-containing protein [Bacteroidales bacterium]